MALPPSNFRNVSWRPCGGTIRELWRRRPTRHLRSTRNCRTGPMQPLETIRDTAYAVIDVRSPAEYAQGHIPRAENIALFTNEERAEVGTLYVQQSREQALLRGLELVGPKLAGFVTQAQAIAQGRPVVLYCWRGGMRSASMAWLLRTAGLDVETIKGGYKAYRAHVHELLSKPWDLRVVAGYTGSGKTHYLHSLAAQGEQVLDLEAICRHKGSSYGALGELPQPSTEYAMNLMADVLAGFDLRRPVWVEDESRKVGHVVIPDVFFERMQASTIVLLDVPREVRVQNLVQDYGHYDVQELVAATERIRRRLGGEQCTAAIAAIQDGDLTTAAAILLDYYDAAYDHYMKYRARSRS
ncbi:MAG: tRNA 2-selenouridine(34) synthase MnmH [Candidatus Kapabacteria bacterium]|nr:tRNA 2-selenouridine(34) synthase MnmH [Candidatus Kapabacteria bacterium]